MFRLMYTPVIEGPPFWLESIAPVDAPDGSGAEWHRYVITQGTDQNRIVGMRCGTRVEVVQRLDAMIDSLNDRRLGHRPKPKGNLSAGRT